MSQRRLIGHWLGARAPDLPDPRDFIDPSWDVDERSVVADYLERGRRAGLFMGPSRCRLCGELVGNLELEDSVYA